MFTSLFSSLIHQFNSNGFGSVPHIQTRRGSPWTSPRIVEGEISASYLYAAAAPECSRPCVCLWVCACVCACVHIESYSTPSDASPFAGAPFAQIFLFLFLSPLPATTLLPSLSSALPVTSDSPHDNFFFFFSLLSDLYNLFFTSLTLFSDSQLLLSSLCLLVCV